MPKMKKLLSVLLVVGLCFSGSIYASGNTKTEGVAIAQQRSKVSGKVDDAFGSIAGASISIKGTTTGTITDLDGNFSLEVNNGQTIVISFIGYLSKEVVYNGQSTLNITLEEDTQKLDEVVVTALGMSREKKALGYAMTELSGEEIARVNSANPINGLQGKVAGVQINMGSSGPQSSNRIMIRGNSSLGKNNQPIFVIDGTIIDNTMNESTEWGSQQDFGNDIKNLNPDDFESMSVLKGAAATALYGSRAANGVVMITTKKGKAGEGIGVTASHSMTWDDVYKFPSIQNQFGPGVNSAWGLNADGSVNRYTSETRNFGPAFDGLPYSQGSDSQNFIYAAQKDNLKELYQTGQYMNTNVAVQGGDEKGTFRASYSYLTSNGVTLNNDYKRNSISLNASRNISKRLKADFGIAWVRSDTKNPTAQGGANSPIYDFVYQVPRTYNTSYWRNNYAKADYSGYNEDDPTEYTKKLFNLFENNHEQKEDNIRGNVNLDFMITSWLNLKLMGNMNKLSILREKKYLADGKSNYDGSVYKIEKSDKDQYQITAMLNAHQQFENFGVNGSVAVEQYDTRTSFHNAESQGGLRLPGVYDMTNSVKQAKMDVRLDDKRKRINSIYAFVNLDWKGQVFLDITGRNDWSSSLIYPNGDGNVSYFYPSASASWIATETFRDQLPDFISFAKVRGSYAIVGNDCEPYLTGKGFYKLDTDNNTYINPNDGNEYPKYVFDATELRNLNLKPEKQHAIEFGAEMKFLQNRLGFDFAWYKTNTKNQILALEIPRETGLTKRWINAGDIQNTGIELAVNAVPFQNRDWRWDISANVTKNNNKIIELTDGVEKYEIEGGGMDMKAYASVGGGYADIYTAYAYKRNEKGEILVNPNGTWSRSGEQTKVGNGNPKVLAGLNTSLTYKDFSLSVVMDARFGGQVVSGTYNYGMYSGALEGSLAGRTQEYGGLPRTLSDGRTVYDGMLPEGVFDKGTEINGVDVSGMSYKDAYEKGLVEAISASDYYYNKFSWGTGIREAAVKDISWIALREISFRWNLPRKWATAAYLQNVNVGVSVRNLGYLYNNLPDDIHPEGLSSNRSYEFYESGGAAYSRTYGFNINVTF